MVSGLQHMKLNNGGRDKPAQLFPLTESPGTPAKSAASSSDLGSWTGSSPGSLLGSLAGHHAVRRSPLSRNVVTALEAELDQVRWWWPLATPLAVLWEVDTLDLLMTAANHLPILGTRDLSSDSPSQTRSERPGSHGWQFSPNALQYSPNALQFPLPHCSKRRYGTIESVFQRRGQSQSRSGNVASLV